MFRWFRWQLAKRRFAAKRSESNLILQLHSSSANDFLPNTRAYDRLAGVWDDFHSREVQDYGRLLAAAQKYYAHPIRTVLDLACGTGLITRQFTGWADSVVGLDLSEQMLAEARSRTNAGNVRYLQGDFRDFDLGEAFDAVVCGGDSLSYLEKVPELARVFQCVHRHLRPGGLFVFHANSDVAFQELARAKIVAQIGDEPFEIYFFYNSKTRTSESRVVFRSAIERHRRIPIEKRDVHDAAVALGFIGEYFSSSLFLETGRYYYVLQRVG